MVRVTQLPTYKTMSVVCQMKGRPGMKERGIEGRRTGCFECNKDVVIRGVTTDLIHIIQVGDETGFYEVLKSENAIF